MKEEYAVTILRNRRRGTETELWMANGRLHRNDDKPAVIEREIGTGRTVSEAWLKNGHLHREGAPAIIARNRRTGALRATYWYEDDLKLPRPARNRATSGGALNRQHPSGPASGPA
jgi:hypothetical protein